MLAALIGGLVAIAAFWLIQPKMMIQGEPVSANSPARLTNYYNPGTIAVPEGLNFITAAEVATPAVVHIRSTYNASATSNRPQGNYRHPFEDMFPDLFGNPGGQRSMPGPRGSSGSGVIMSGDGYIVTNNHVIDNADEIEVVLNDNRSYKAELIGTDPNTDIALLKIEPNEELPFLSYGNSDAVRVGEWVLAVGNPFDLTSTVTAGIVSAKTRSIGILARSNTNARGINTAIESFIQTDAAVNPGNSGGALVNLKGELIGINTAIASNTGSYAGYSFAVPTTLVRKIVEDLKEYGVVQRALLGVNIQDVSASLSEAEDLGTTRGVYISNVNEGSAADEAGLEKGDVILEINGKNVNSVSALQESIARNRPGDEVEVTFLRSGRTRKLPVTLKNSMGTTRMLTSNSNLEIGGAVLGKVSGPELSKLGLEGGVKVEKLGNGKLKDAKVREGFIITSIDNQKIESIEDVTQILSSKRNQGTLIEGIYPNGEKAYYGLPW
jgi:Do/DeqQ family serine protease